MWYFSDCYDFAQWHEKCLYGWRWSVIPLAQKGHSMHCSDSKEHKFVHISPFLVFQISMLCTDQSWIATAISFSPSLYLLYIFDSSASQFLFSHCRYDLVQNPKEPISHKFALLKPNLQSSLQAQCSLHDQKGDTLPLRLWHFQSSWWQGTRSSALIAHLKWHWQAFQSESKVDLKTSGESFLSLGQEESPSPQWYAFHVSNVPKHRWPFGQK